MEAFEKEKSAHQQKCKNIMDKLEEAEKSHSPNLEELKQALKDLEKEKENIQKEEIELKKKDKVN